ncbi:germin-like protein subfamily 1 member 1 [Mercurialis annua]|uniref:germin-like protein subfamily 1 member 1 n=1 Tax=Mercurialis annua TaxID=3986 RepID=UPI00215E5C52|nr:germin-like protein subfamily 1 member 1 [Mercurialis annua]
MYSFSFFYKLITLAFLMGLAKPDPGPLQDYCIADSKSSFYMNGVPCINPKLATSAHFTTSALAKAGNTRANPFGFNVTLTNVKNLPGMNTLGLALARVDIVPNGIVPPHSHPRASEVTICLKGSILVGFVDSSNNLHTQRLREGESFVFPKGLIHFLSNVDPMRSAVAVSGLSSQNPGAQIASLASFRSNPFIPDDVLKKAFQITSQDVIRIRRNLGG